MQALRSRQLQSSCHRNGLRREQNPRPRTLCLIRAAAADTQVAVGTEGLVLGRGGPGSWDEAAVGNPVVRCYIGDNEQRWYMWYSGANAALPGLAAVAPAAGSVGVAVSHDGISWLRGDGVVEGLRGAEQLGDVGVVLQPNSDNWWTLDTCHLAVSDVQVLSSSSVSSGVGVSSQFHRLPVHVHGEEPPAYEPPQIDIEAQVAAMVGVQAASSRGPSTCWGGDQGGDSGGLAVHMLGAAGLTV